MKHDADIAIDFLSWAYPEGPWCLTAIEVDAPGIDTETFYPETSDQLRAFLDRFARRNLYWSANRPLYAMSKKTEKTDIAAAHFLHVDIDPRVDLSLKTPEELAAHIVRERVRILALLSNPPAPVPRPTIVVFSGGGYQALWRLSEPFIIDGDLARAEELESYNRQLEIVFGADACHNVDRILRLVGSTNFPHAKKRLKGRTVERAAVI